MPELPPSFPAGSGHQGSRGLEIQLQGSLGACTTQRRAGSISVCTSVPPEMCTIIDLLKKTKTESVWGLALEPLEEEEEASPAANTKNGL